MIEALEGLVRIQVAQRHPVLGGDQAQREQMTIERLAAEHALCVRTMRLNGSMQEPQAFAVRHMTSERVVVVVVVQIEQRHGAHELDRLCAERAYDLGATEAESTQRARLVGVGHAAAAGAIVGQLHGDLHKRVRANLVRLGEVLAERVEAQHEHVQVVDRPKTTRNLAHKQKQKAISSAPVPVDRVARLDNALLDVGRYVEAELLEEARRVRLVVAGRLRWQFFFALHSLQKQKQQLHIICRL